MTKSTVPPAGRVVEEYALTVMRSVMNALLYFPSRKILQTPAVAGLAFADVAFAAGDGERLHGWWVPARAPSIGHVLLCHGNAGNVGDRVAHLELLSAAGFDVLAFDYRGYGRSSGRPSEQGTYLDARAARDALRSRDGVDVSPSSTSASHSAAPSPSPSSCRPPA